MYGFLEFMSNKYRLRDAFFKGTHKFVSKMVLIQYQMKRYIKKFKDRKRRLYEEEN